MDGYLEKGKGEGRGCLRTRLVDHIRQEER